MFKKVSVSELKINPFTKIGDEWMLLSAGGKDKLNTMTASWGAAGVIWGVNALTCYVRPQRYTNEFMSREGYFTACFFGEGNSRAALELCGSKSGRDCDKIAQSGLTAAFYDVSETETAPYFEEAETVFICRKLHAQRIDPAGFCDPEIDKNYPAGDYHFMYIGEIVDCLVRNG